MPVAIGGDILPSPVGIGLTDLQNIGGGGNGPPGPPGSGITAMTLIKAASLEFYHNINKTGSSIDCRAVGMSENQGVLVVISWA